MKNKDLFYKTIDILVGAYLNETLLHNDPCGCAIGNLVCYGLGLKNKIVNGRAMWSDGTIGFNTRWDYVHTYFDGIDISKYEGQAKKEIDSTGYSMYETHKIEIAFESQKPDVFTSLMSVVDCLIEIHQGNENETEAAKLLFVKELA